ncbi:response regulator transcription factor [Arcobacter sp. FWKO B]|uniref:response regulator transcription factor n=1 Tax=Arcobacter sp. FWKO B TaxID=2593672 RepID=UPI0018A5274A|nr:response regulator transcription factor [Arcobacter sp. FWKO B]QOG11927.1 response regulator transcription factor [Arcobacter sp. FWKO B]
MKILVLEDDLDYQQSIKEYLVSLGYEVDVFEDGQEAYYAVYEKSYHLLLLDIRVPTLNGYELVKKLKSDGKDVPVIFVTSLTDINNLSIGYELGCSDYIKKPFALKELKYRVEQILKLYYFHSNSDKVMLNYGYSYDIKNEILYKNNEIIGLTNKEKSVVFLLVSNLNNYVPIERIKDEVWQDSYINDVDVRMCIKNIRKKSDKDFITSMRGLGYKIDKG